MRLAPRPIAVLVPAVVVDVGSAAAAFAIGRVVAAVVADAAESGANPVGRLYLKLDRPGAPSWPDFGGR